MGITPVLSIAGQKYPLYFEDYWNFSRSFKMLVYSLQDFLQDREHCSEKPLVFVEQCFGNTDLEDFICAM
jgi:hypothetical protein